MKIVWICHFSNEEVRDHLPLNKMGKAINSYAQWITNTIDEFKKIETVELHIISPHYGLKKITCSFVLDGIHYHFYKADIPLINKSWPSYFRLDRWTKYLGNYIIVYYLLSKIKPDLINLWGAENPYYSSTVLGIKKIPILITIQGIYSNPDRFKSIREDIFRSTMERKIHAQNKYFGISAPFMTELIKRDVESPILFWTEVVKNIQIPIDTNISKEYDFVMFSRLSKLKGCEDVLDALVKVKEAKHDVSLRMMGPPSTPGYIEYLNNRAKILGLENNVLITHGYSRHQDLLMEAARARFYILPTHLDTLPGTIFEAIYLNLPVVSYLTGEIPILNKGENRALLCKIGDVSALAANMLRLLNDPELGIELSLKATAFVDKWYNNTKIANNFVEQYRNVYDNFHFKKPISTSLLYENFMSVI